MEEKKSYLYSTKNIILFVLLISILATGLTFFSKFSIYDKNNFYNWLEYQINYSISASLYDEENNTMKGIVNYYIKSEKEAKGKVDFEILKNYSVIKFSKDYVYLKKEDGTKINFRKIPDDNEAFYEAIYELDDGSSETREISQEEFEYYNPNYSHKPLKTTTNYLTNDKIFKRQLGGELKFEPSRLKLAKDYIYIKGKYNGEKSTIEASNAGLEDRDSQKLLEYLEDNIRLAYRDIDSANKIKNLDFAYTINNQAELFKSLEANKIWHDNFIFQFVIFSLAAIGIFLITGIFLDYEKISETYLYKKLSKIPFDLELIVLTILVSLASVFFSETFNRFSETFTRYLDFKLGIFIYWSLMFVVGLAILQLIFLLKNVAREGKQGDLIKNSLIGLICTRLVGGIIRRLIIEINKFTNNLEGTNKITVFAFIGFLLFIGFVGANIFTRAPMPVFILWTILILGIAGFLKRYYDDIKKIEEYSNIMKSGNFLEKMDEEKTHFKSLVHNLNTVNENMDLAVEKAIKSERMKTELITNVSHDLKTPLTSIINYSELITGENISNVERAEYAKIINEKSHKLRILIENLFEVSKVSSKNIELNLEELDFSQLVAQVLGEWEDKLSSKGIESKLSIPEKPVLIKLDGNQTYRILENLFSNIYKYGQENTRLYIDLTKGENVELTMKNISKYPLNISADELLERFTRGDASRNTEGSGLGLSIASSLTELQGGKFELEIDGDLFKTKISF